MSPEDRLALQNDEDAQDLMAMIEDLPLMDRLVILYEEALAKLCQQAKHLAHAKVMAEFGPSQLRRDLAKGDLSEQERLIEEARGECRRLLSEIEAAERCP